MAKLRIEISDEFPQMYADVYLDGDYIGGTNGYTEAEVLDEVEWIVFDYWNDRRGY